MPHSDFGELEQRGIRKRGRLGARWFATHYHRLRIVGEYSLPEGSPAIIVSNHTSYADPLFIQAACPRLIAWMIAREYQELPGVSWICRTIETIPVTRDGRDMAATRQALRALAGGRVLGVFPEGKIETSREFLPFQVGPALLAMRTGAAVVPVYIDGTQRAAATLPEAYMAPQSAVVCIGRPLTLCGDGSRQALEEGTERIREAIAAMRDLVESAIWKKPMAWLRDAGRGA